MIALEAIHKRFADVDVLRGISLVVPERSVTALIGPSGSGKSTLLRCVNLLEMPHSGSVTVGDARVRFAHDEHPARAEVLAMRRKTGMVFQNFQLFPHLTVIENVMEGLVTVLRWPRERAKAHARDLLDKVGMVAKADAWPANLSGGQQQRVAIARALAPSPQVLLCDEPTSALDPELAAEVVEVLAQLAREGTTMLMATHDLRLAQTIAAQVVFLDRGEVVESGTGREVFHSPQRERTRQFVASLKAERRDEHDGSTGPAQ